MEESLEALFFLHLTRTYAAFALRTSSRTDSNEQNTADGSSSKKANVGMPHPTTNAHPNDHHGQPKEVNPNRQLWIFFDGVIPPFLVLLPIVSTGWSLGPQFENDPFHDHPGDA